MKKRLTLLSLFIALVINAMAYTPIVIEGYKWNIVNRKAMLDANGTIEYKTMIEKIEGDTIINEVPYKKLWHTTDEDLTEYELIGIIREDIENQKVYAFIEGKEYLLYDFACNVGDKITTLTGLFRAEQAELNIKAIEMITDLEGNIVRKITAFIENFNRDIIFYERYGSENGWYMRQYSSNTGGGVNFIVCAFDEEDALLLKPTYNNELDEIKDCYMNETKTDIPNVESQSDNVYYNNENHTLTFDIENLTAITIYDAMGKMVMTREINSTTKSIPINLTPGIYIVTNKNQNIYSKIVIK